MRRYDTLQNTEGDLAPLGDELQLKWTQFDTLAAPKLSPNDVLIFLLGTVDLTSDEARKGRQKQNADGEFFDLVNSSSTRTPHGGVAHRTCG